MCIAKSQWFSCAEGPAVIKAQQETGKIFQVGSQGVSSLGNEKAKQLLKDGAIGQLNYAEGFWARHSHRCMAISHPCRCISAKQWTGIHLSAILLNDLSMPRVFSVGEIIRIMEQEWQVIFLFTCFQAFTLSQIHSVLNKIYAAGGLRYWKDGREVPDVLLGTFDYPQSAGASCVQSVATL